MTPSQQLAARRAAKAARVSERPKAHLKSSVVPAGIVGLPIGGDNNPSESQYNTRSLRRMFTSLRSASDWDASDMNEMIFLYNTVASLLQRWVEYRGLSVRQWNYDLQDVLRAIKQRKRDHGHYGVTGDEWSRLRTLVHDLQGWLRSVPLVRVNAAEEHVVKVARVD